MPLSLLRSGDPVSVVAPAGPFEPEPFERGLQALRSLGFEPRPGPGIGSRTRYLAGSDDRRLEELVQAFRDPETRAVFCARGGYGAMRLLPQFRVEGLPDKPLVGFSDITALHLVWQRAGRVSVHGPVVTQLGTQPESVLTDLRALLMEGRSPALSGIPVREGRVSGPVVGGNLSVVTRLLGTPFLPSLKGALLVLEEVGERPYRLDRMLTHLRLAGIFEQVAGVAFGQLTGCEERDAPYTSGEVVGDFLRTLPLPSVMGLPFGHGEINRPLLLGVPATLDADQGVLSY